MRKKMHEGTHDSNCQRKIILQEAEPNYGLHDRQSADHNQRDNQRKILMMHIYNDIIEHRQYSVYTSKNSLTTYGIVDLMEKLSQKLPWLYLCINEIDVTDIGEQYSVKGILREFINQEEILIIKEKIPKEEK